MAHRRRPSTSYFVFGFAASTLLSCASDPESLPQCWTTVQGCIGGASSTGGTATSTGGAPSPTTGGTTTSEAASRRANRYRVYCVMAC